MNIPFIFIFTPITVWNAEIDKLGYEYTYKEAKEIDFSDEDFYIVPTRNKSIHAVYYDSEVEKFERTSLSLFTNLPTSFSQHYSSSNWITK